MFSLGSALALSVNTKIIDAQGAYITPGGVDSHVHLERTDCRGGGVTWKTGTIAGGKTTVIAFASQQKQNTTLFPILDEYHGKTDTFSYCDFGFHMILTNPTDHIVQNELPLLVEREGTSVKLYMTYESFKLGDRAILDIIMSARRLGITTMIHAENSDMISLITERLEQ
jgi:dihydropyrimidinase